VTVHDLDKYRADALADLHATSESWHSLIGGLVCRALMSDTVKSDDVVRMLLEAEAFGNERRARDGIEADTSAADYLVHLRGVFAQADAEVKARHA